MNIRDTHIKAHTKTLLSLSAPPAFVPPLLHTSANPSCCLSSILKSGLTMISCASCSFRNRPARALGIGTTSYSSSPARPQTSTTQPTHPCALTSSGASRRFPSLSIPCMRRLVSVHAMLLCMCGSRTCGGGVCGAGASAPRGAWARPSSTRRAERLAATPTRGRGRRTAAQAQTTEEKSGMEPRMWGREKSGEKRYHPLQLYVHLSSNAESCLSRNMEVSVWFCGADLLGVVVLAGPRASSRRWGGPPACSGGSRTNCSPPAIAVSSAYHRGARAGARISVGEGKLGRKVSLVVVSSISEENCNL